MKSEKVPLPIVRYIVYTVTNRYKHKFASCPDWRISPHADRRSPRNTNSLQHWPSPTMRRPVCHSRHGAPLSSRVCRTRLTTVERVIDFPIFDLGAYPWAKGHQKGRWPGGLRDIASCKISSLYANPRRRYPLPKILRTDRTTNKQ